MIKKSKSQLDIHIKDEKSFRDYLLQHKIVPLNQESADLPKATPKEPEFTKTALIVKKSKPQPLTDNHNLKAVTADEIISFARPDLSYKTLRRLRAGKIHIEATLDLHGMSAEKAERQLMSFLNHSLERDLRCILIIHGKGKITQKPILKNKINSWLRHLNIVLAFCSAKPKHGGQGAVYVLLRKNV